MKRSAKYYQGYRRVRSNVAQHLSAIYSDSAGGGGGDTADFCDSDSHDVSDQTRQHVLNTENQTGLSAEVGSSCQFSDQQDHEDVGVSFEDHEEDNSDSLHQGSISNDDLTDIDDVQNQSMFSSDSDSESCNVDDSDLEYDLRVWVSQFNIPHNAVRELLLKLHQFHPSLPKDPRTLLKTQTNYEITNIAGGSYYHFGLGNGLLAEIQSGLHANTDDISVLRVQLNIDGLPLFKSSSTQFWPILGRACHPFVSKPFVIGIFLGQHKPTSIDLYLQSLVNEITILNDCGLQMPQTDQHIKIEISCVICDTPARAFVKQSKGHSGYYGCDKCVQKGQYINHRMTFPETNSPLRTDVQFDELEQEQHHVGHSPFSRTCVGPVSQFPIDYMHLVCLGVMKRLLWLWTKGSARQGSVFSTRVSDRIAGLSSFMPREFLRKGRSLCEMDRWKATEFRTFLVYSGQVVLKGILPKEMYKHFKLLCVAVYCLSSPVFCQPYMEFANQLLVTFVKQFGGLYGDDQYVYNVHGLVHLANDVSRFGYLDHYSSFPFESYLGKLKKLVRKPNYPLQQVIRRLSEKSALNVNAEAEIQNAGIVKKRHNHGPRLHEYADYFQFEEITLPGCFLSIQQGNNCILLGEKVGLIRNILSPFEQSAERIFVVQWFRGVLGCFYTEPLHSSDLRVFKVSQLLEDTAAVKAEDLTCKCVLLPYKNHFVVIPLIHSL